MVAPPTHEQDHTIKGMGYAACAFFMFAVMNCFAKALSHSHHAVEVAFFRNAVGLLPFLFWIYVMGRKEIIEIKSNPKAIVVRSVAGTVSLGLTFGAFAIMPLADATAFLFTSSLLIPAFGFFFLKEHVGIYRWSAILVGFTGVIVMLRPGEGGIVNPAGVALALSAAFMHATLQIILRSLGKSERPETVTFYFMFIGAFVSLIPMPFFFKMPTLAELPLILGVGISGLLAQLFLSAAYKNARAAIVTVFNYSNIIWATLFGFLFWDEWPDRAIFIGGAIVIASNVFIVYREQKLARIARAKVQIADVT